MYPQGRFRIHYNVSTYCDIARRRYLSLCGCYTELRGYQTMGEAAAVLSGRIQEEAIASVVFAAMAAEAFLNDYGAVCLGDEFYYENLDVLSPLKKFNVISLLILGRAPDKGGACYGLLKQLFARRNEYVHSKSRELDIPEEPEPVPPDWEPDLTLDLTDARESARLAFDALRALYELARWFDAGDPQVHAGMRLVGSRDFYRLDREAEEIQRRVRDELEGRRQPVWYA